MGDLFERARLLEEMRRAWDDLHLLFAPESREGLLVEINHNVIFAANNEQSGRFNPWQGIVGKVRPAATRHNGFDLFAQLRGCNERGRGAGARAKETQVNV